MSISVVIPTFNRGAQIGATIDSVLSQTLTPLEILVVDDGSTDGTADWVKAHYAQQVRVIRQANGGVANARNRGLEEARGEFIAYLDHDDLWLPEKLEKQAALFSSENVGVVYCYWREVNEAGCVLNDLSVLAESPHWKLPEGDVEPHLLKGNFLISMSVPLIRTQLLREVGGFDARMVPCDDWDVWVKCSARAQFKSVKEVCVVYLRHQNQQSRDELKMWNATRRLLLKHRHRTWRYPKAFWFGVTGSWYFKTATPFYGDAKKAISRADWKHLLLVMARCFVKHPYFLLTPQWCYVTLRLLKRDARPF